MFWFGGCGVFWEMGFVEYIGRWEIVVEYFGRWSFCLWGVLGDGCFYGVLWEVEFLFVESFERWDGVLLLSWCRVL